MAFSLPPWLDVRPHQFTEAAVAGGQLGQRTAQEASELAQRGIISASEIVNRAEALQVQRESIAAELAGRQAIANQRASEAASEMALRQQMFDQQKAVSQAASQRMAEHDAVLQEGMSRYQRAVNAGDDPAAADLEILQPLRDVGIVPRGTNKGKATPSQDWSGPINLGSGEVIQVNKRDGTTRQAHAAKAPEDKAETARLKEAATVKGKKFDSDLKAVDRQIAAERALLANAVLEEDKNKILGRLFSLDRERTKLFATQTFEPRAAVAPQQWQVDPNTIPTGAPKSFMIPPMPTHGGSTNQSGRQVGRFRVY